MKKLTLYLTEPDFYLIWNSLSTFEESMIETIEASFDEETIAIAAKNLEHLQHYKEVLEVGAKLANFDEKFFNTADNSYRYKPH